MLVVTLHNQGIKEGNKSDYECKVMITVSETELKTIWSGRVRGFQRARGWDELLKELVKSYRNPE